MSQTTLEDAVATLTAAALEDGEHPSIDELVAYDAEKLPADVHGRIQEHLVWCSECSNTVVDLKSWPDVELRDSALERTADEEADDWQAIQRRIAGDDAPADEEGATAPVPFSAPTTASESIPASRSAWQPIHLLAAALLLAVLGLSIQLAKLSRELLTPQANVFVADLEPEGGATTRNASPNGETQVPAGMNTIVFLLIQDDVLPFDNHTAELLDDSGEILWQSEELVRAPEGGFSIAVPLAVLPSDSVEIRLFGVGPEKRELLATYRTHIERGPSD